MNARVVRILLVEDSPSDRELTGLAFKRARIANQLTTAEDGEHALEVLAEASELPDLILLDLNMPGMDGRELLKHLKADPKYASIPVVILTSSVNETDVAQAYQN
ncbi:MAG: chemotaxis family two-component system response regulator Rcp1, partial [Myxococcota bacterium]